MGKMKVSFPFLCWFSGGRNEVIFSHIRMCDQVLERTLDLIRGFDEPSIARVKERDPFYPDYFHRRYSKFVACHGTSLPGSVIL